MRCRCKHSANHHHPLETGEVVNQSRGTPQAVRENGKPGRQAEPDPRQEDLGSQMLSGLTFQNL